MTVSDADPRLARITVYPVKSLDGVDRERAACVAGGGLELDRAYALVDADGAYVNGKQEPKVHRLRSQFDPETRTLELTAPNTTRETFELPDPSASEETRNAGASTEAETDALTAWLSDYFGYDVSFRCDATGGFPDDTTASGPTVISTATIEEVASWYPDIDPHGMRRRLRANLEIDGVPPFWEDHLFADREHVVSFSVGEVTLDGVNPCQRCVVPSRDPDTGEETDGFRERFVRRREETMPAWSGGDWFDHSFRLMVNTRLTDAGEVAVGDPVEVDETRPVA